MFTSRKRIFAGKSNLYAEPLCPYYTNESGRNSLKRSLARTNKHPGETPHARTFWNGGKLYV